MWTPVPDVPKKIFPLKGFQFSETQTGKWIVSVLEAEPKGKGLQTPAVEIIRVA